MITDRAESESFPTRFSHHASARAVLSGDSRADDGGDRVAIPPERGARSRAETGRAGEEQAALGLSARGWGVIARNWRTRRGEIDIIAIDGDTLVFVEVKTWPHGTEDDLELAIGPAKRKRMAETAKCFLDTHRQYSGMYVRFDVILACSAPGEGGAYRFRHLRDAFSEREE